MDCLYAAYPFIFIHTSGFCEVSPVYKCGLMFIFDVPVFLFIPYSGRFILVRSKIDTYVCTLKYIYLCKLVAYILSFMYNQITSKHDQIQNWYISTFFFIKQVPVC